MARPAAIEGTVRADLFRLLRRTAELVVPPVRRVSKVRDDPARTEKKSWSHCFCETSCI